MSQGCILRCLGRAAVEDTQKGFDMHLTTYFPVHDAFETVTMCDG